MAIDRKDLPDTANWKTPQELADLRRVVALDIPGGSEFEDNSVRAQNGAGGHDVIREVCAECHLNPPDGSELLRRLSATENLWLHRRCEDAFIRRRMEEEGISWSTMPRSTAPAPSVEKTIDGNGGSPPPPPTRQDGAAQATAPSPPLAVTLTRFTNDNGESLTKKIALAADGISTDSDKTAMVMYRGSAMRVRVTGVAGLGTLIESSGELAGDRARRFACRYSGQGQDCHHKGAARWQVAGGPHRPHQRKHRL